MRQSNEPMPWPTFVHRFFEGIGARPIPADPGIRVTLTPEQLRLVEGRPRSLLGWDALWGGMSRNEKTTLFLTFDTLTQSVPGERDPSDDDLFELCVPGSFRGRQLIDAALRLWPVGRTHVSRASPAPSSSVRRWHPYMVFHFCLSYIAFGTRRRSKTVPVDLLSGAIVPIEELGSEIVQPQGDGAVAEPPLLNVGDAYERATAHVEKVLRAEDSSWTDVKRGWLGDELEQLRTYVRRAELEEQSDVLHELHRVRREEFYRLQPRVDVRIAATTIVYSLRS